LLKIEHVEAHQEAKEHWLAVDAQFWALATILLAPPEYLQLIVEYMDSKQARKDHLIEDVS